MNDSKTDYYTRVYQIVSEIPEGKVTTYGAIAGKIGIESGARMVGYALNNLIHSTEENIPAHRVVNRLGQLTGKIHFPGDTMRERLLQENVRFIDEDTVDIENHFWRP